MNRHPNHCACPRCGSRLPQVDPQEMLEAASVREMGQSLLLKGWNRKQEETSDA